MKKILIALPLLALCGCGHNAIQYGDGIGFDLGLNPENYTFSFNLRYGKILSAVVRDNAEIELTGDVATNTQPANVSTGNNLKIKIGRQINGAAVDMVKAGTDGKDVMEALK